MENYRGWIITFLYLVLGIIALLLLFSSIQISVLANEIPFLLIVLAILSTASAYLCFKATLRFFLKLRSGKPIPKLDLWPFLSVATMLVVAIRLFTHY